MSLYKSRGMNGQGLVEFALILPILLLLIIGTLDLGFAFFTKVVLENSAREGAYYMVYNTDEGKADDFAKVRDAVQIEAENSGMEIPDEDIEIGCMEGGSVNNNCPSGSTVIVTVHHELALILDMFSSGPLDLTNEARMLIP